MELSETATLKSGANTYTCTGLVEMAGGELLISGGSILPYKDNYPWAEMIATHASSPGKNIITMTAGNVYGYINSKYGMDFIKLQGGSLYGIHAWNLNADIVISGAFDLENFSGMPTDKNVHPKFDSALRNDITFQNRVESLAVDNVLAESLAGSYQLTESDVSHIRYLPSEGEKEDYQVYLESGSAKVKKNEEPKTAADLQALLDAIAARGTATEANPETITLPAEGIEVNTSVYVRAGCHAILTGGSLTMGQFAKGGILST